jgi:hypothetical protein
MPSSQLARKTGTHERYMREWLNNQAAGGYVVYDPVRKTYELPEEQALVLANAEGPASSHPPSMSSRAYGWMRTRSRTHFVAAKALVGTSTTIACSSVPRRSSAQATGPI